MLEEIVAGLGLVTVALITRFYVTYNEQPRYELRSSVASAIAQKEILSHNTRLHVLQIKGGYLRLKYPTNKRDDIIAILTRDKASPPFEPVPTGATLHVSQWMIRGATPYYTIPRP